MSVGARLGGLGEQIAKNLVRSTKVTLSPTILASQRTNGFATGASPSMAPVAAAFKANNELASTTTTTTTTTTGKQTSLASQLGARVHSFDHVTFWVGNAKHSAVFFMTQLGFKPYAFKGLESGSRNYACHVVKLNDTIIKFVSAVEPNNEQFGRFLTSHGDSVKDVAFRVENLEPLLEHALKQGASLVTPLEAHNIDPDGRYQVKFATIKAFGDVTHTLIERNYDYDQGRFLPGFTKPSLEIAPALAHLDPIGIIRTDHIVGQFPPNKLEQMTEWYAKVLDFDRFWSVDEKDIHTEHSGVKSHVVTNHNESIKMPLCEVMLSKKAKSKAEEFVRYNDGSGIHHIALLTDDIVTTVSRLKTRGLEFLNTPDIYYDQLKERLSNCPISIHEDIEQLRKLKILVDFDEQGYLLQIFTRPIQDRPTLIFEFIQRYNNNGFGTGNFLHLFKAIEAEQALRGNL